MTKKDEKYKIHPLSVDDALNMAGILAGGGLAGDARSALARIERDGMGAGLEALSSLAMGALANVNTRDQMRGFLFDVWKTTEDEQALEEDLNIQDRLEPRFELDEAGNIKYHPNTGEALFDKKSLYYRKLKRFHKLPPAAAAEITRLVFHAPEFKSFLASLRGLMPESSTADATDSNGTTTSMVRP